MRLLLDENLDWRLRHDLVDHQVESVPLIGWAGIENGELLRKAVETRFDVLVTMDSNTRPLMPALTRVAPKYQARYSDVSS